MRRLLILLLSLIILGAVSAQWLLQTLKRPIAVEKTEIVDVLYGDSVYKVAAKLAQKGYYPHPPVFVWYARLLGHTAIKAGEYNLHPGMSALDLLDAMNDGLVIDYPVTFIEGQTIGDAITTLQKSYGIISTINSTDEEALLSVLGASPRYSHSEGLLFPDTYRYIKGNKDSDVLRRAFQAMEKALDEAWQEAQGKKLPYKNAYELLIMASIIERETAVDSEREQIAGVFVQRLQKSMRLQTDLMVIYGMGEGYKGRITRRDLRNPTPYNTYTINGLPPTPIGLVSKASMLAAANPLLNGKLYFVAKGDGHHQFSTTLAEHNQAVRRYQLQRSSNYRSTPLKQGSNEE